jgi:hypothetical protein
MTLWQLDDRDKQFADFQLRVENITTVRVAPHARPVYGSIQAFTPKPYYAWVGLKHREEIFDVIIERQAVPA